mgnify:CR=1 FL=1
MTSLSVNINKVATLRNARGGNIPNLLEVAIDLQRFGAQGITVHPRPDQRHIRYNDAIALPEIITTEYNIEGNPISAFKNLVLKIKPTQVTLVPDSPDAITSNSGWDTIKHQSFFEIQIKREFKRKRKQKRKRGSLREGREAPPRRCPHPLRFCFRFRFNLRLI